MQFRIFSVPVFDEGAIEDELNRFLRSHKIVDVNKQYSERASAWTFCVTYMDINPSTANALQTRKEKIDYKEILDEQTFARFAHLREARKLIANDESIPAYAVFTNEELAQIAALEEITEGSIASIKGIGDKRTEKYGQRLIDHYNKRMSQ